ncbi:MAG: sugar phosphate nucleotidyltransferase [Desulfobacteraceae bacterium]|jgi:NDP-sugar pyrophosphorylase family protein
MQANADRYPGLAVLLAAGLGKRLLPFTKQTPKAMLQSGGRPLIQYAFNALMPTRIKKVVLVTNYLEYELPDLINQMIAKSISVRGYFGDRFDDWERRYRPGFGVQSSHPTR